MRCFAKIILVSERDFEAVFSLLVLKTENTENYDTAMKPYN